MNIVVGVVALVIGLLVLAGHKHLVKVMMAGDKETAAGAFAPSEGYGRAIVLLCGVAFVVGGILTVTGILHAG